MLILTRTINEKFVIGDDVTVTILDLIGRHVRIGIVAPLEIPVYREEIYRRILKERATDNTQAPASPHQTDS